MNIKKDVGCFQALAVEYFLYMEIGACDLVDAVRSVNEQQMFGIPLTHQ